MIIARITSDVIPKPNKKNNPILVDIKKSLPFMAHYSILKAVAPPIIAQPPRNFRLRGGFSFCF
ncbi:MAG: hypothetical protein IKL57_02705 [Oscillospiraceae bacterium]|nr:hypothetical protein [Oscillospiraceae bacterium]